MTPSLLSPVTGRPLVPEGENLLCDRDGRLWPVLDGIPFLRIGRDALVDAAVACVQAGDRDGALVLLLADQDDWWTGAKPKAEALRRLVAERDSLSLRAAMDLLGYDRVGHYFAHRWSDPTFLAGLGLLEAHWRPAAFAFELACGIGHYGRELARRGVAYTGVDVVFSKLWLARHWVLPAEVALVCFDAAAPWPVAERRFDLVFCHDAFYFLEPKATILAALRMLAGAQGRVTLSHIHNSGADNLSAGRAVSADTMAQLFPDSTIYDDAELTAALIAARAPVPASVAALAHVEAFSVEDRVTTVPRALTGGLAMPVTSAALRLNPLYEPVEDGTRISWPSPRYQAEYGGLATYPSRLPAGPSAIGDHDAARRRIMLDLPERW